MLSQRGVDSNFYSVNGPFLLKEVLEYINCDKNNNEVECLWITSVNKIENAAETDLIFALADKEFTQLANTKSRVCVVNKNDTHKIKSFPKRLQIFTSDNAYYSYAKAISLFYKHKRFTTLKEWENLNNNELGRNTSIHHSVNIGIGTVIGSNTVIGQGVRIGRNCVIRENVSISYTVIGNNVTVDSGCVIGQDGFGFVQHQGQHYSIMHVGRVVIGNNVRIGCNTVIDKGFYEDTIIGDNTLIDSLVKVAHNVKIGKNCIILAQVGIAGGTSIGNNCLIAGQAGLVDYIEVGNKVNIAAKSFVTKSIANGIAVAGYPAMPIREWRKQMVYQKKWLNKLYSNKNQRGGLHQWLEHTTPGSK